MLLIENQANLKNQDYYILDGEQLADISGHLAEVSDGGESVGEDGIDGLDDFHGEDEDDEVGFGGEGVGEGAGDVFDEVGGVEAGEEDDDVEDGPEEGGGDFDLIHRAVL